MPTLLVSIVIPTHNRPQFLPRAVRSALESLPDGDGEVIVVPNGGDESWRQSLTPFINDSRVIVSPIDPPNGNAARNHGMALARGKYIRFLDDDDFLLPGAIAQIEQIEQAHAEICSGRVVAKQMNPPASRRTSFPRTNDFLCAATMVSGFTLPIGNLFARSALGECRWDPSIDRLQDNVWMLDLAAAREWKWVHANVEVGVWLQHGGRRTSTTASRHAPPTGVIERLLALHARIASDNRCNDARSHAIATALWQYIHCEFMQHPLFYSAIAIKAKAVDPRVGPPDIVYKRIPVRYVNPIVMEWACLPLRIVTRTIRTIRRKNINIDPRMNL